MKAHTRVTVLLSAAILRKLLGKCICWIYLTRRRREQIGLLVLCSRDHLIELHVSEKMGKNEQLELHQTRLLKLLTSAELVHSIYKEKEFSRVRKKLFWVQLSLSILRSCIGTTTLCGLLIWGIQGQHRVRKLSQVYPNFQAMSSIFPLLSLCLCLVELLWFAIRKSK